MNETPTPDELWSRDHPGERLPQAYLYNGQSWDVEKARALVVGRQPDVLLLDEDLAEQSKEQLDVDPEWALLHADLSDPVIVIPLPAELFEDFGSDAGDLVIDGWHRIVRAVHQGMGELPAHFLTPNDERLLRDFDDLDSAAPHEPWHATRRPWGESGANHSRRWGVRTLSTGTEPQVTAHPGTVRKGR